MDWLINLINRVKRNEQTEEVDVTVTRRAWLPEEVKFLSKNYRNIGATEVAHHLDRTPDSVRSKAKSLGL